MAKTTCSAEDFIQMYRTLGPAETSRKLGTSVRNTHSRRKRIEGQLARTLVAPRCRDVVRNLAAVPSQRIGWLSMEIKNGTVIVGSDAHYWPGEASTAHRAFVHLCKELKPAAVVMNGDGFDGASISRHPRIGWEDRPTVIEELEACAQRLGEIEQAAGKARKLWPLGNHDARFESRLAMQAPEYAKVHGVHLRDHFPYWEPCWSVEINNDTVIKHRYKSGIHAPHNNTLWAGKTIVTGHLHSAKVMPVTDYNGTRWGVDAGMIAAVGGPQFVDYLENNPVNWRSAFAVLTFWKGILLEPKLCLVLDEENGLVQYLNQVIEV